MSDKYPVISTGGYLEGEDGQLLLGAHFYHPDTGVGYVGEDGTNRQVPAITGSGQHTRFLKGVVVHFHDQPDMSPERVEVDSIQGFMPFPGGMEEAVSKAMKKAGIKITVPEEL